MKYVMDHKSPNFDARGDRAVNTVVIHYTGRPTFDESLSFLMDAERKVSSHYLIDETGIVYQLVSEDRRAWHAGAGVWRDCGDINAASIGIELQNPGHEFGYCPFPSAQINALLDLLADIHTRHDILERNVIGHSDMAPTRKMDPGELFPWDKLAAAGFGLWPDIGDAQHNQMPLQDEDIKHFYAGLKEWGYGAFEDKALTTAFQRHWRPSYISGQPDQGSWAVLKALLKDIR